MCMFGGSTASLINLEVGGTNIFARAEAERQYLVYSMNIAATEPVAMILPLPVPVGTAEDAVAFVDLGGYPSLFSDVNACFPPIYAPASRGLASGSATEILQAPLIVHDVGNFVASFVPSRSEFHRLDRRFRLDDSVWDALPRYADWGYAVFQLKDLGERPANFWDRLFGRRRLSHKTIHPMALSFPRRFEDRLFFPTVHVHDGTVPDREHFDHSLYWQGEIGSGPGTFISEPARTEVDIPRTKGLVLGEERIGRVNLSGERANEDHWVRAGSCLSDSEG